MRISIVLSVSILTIAGGVAYLVMPKGAPESAARGSGSESGTAPDSKAMAVKFAKALEKEIPDARMRADGRDISPERIAEIEGHINAVLKEKGDPRVAERLKPTTETGKRLCRLAMTVRHADQLSDEELKQLASAYLNGFTEARQETLNEARSAIGNLSGTAFAQERLGVYAVLNSMPNASSELKSLALTELTTGAPPARPTAEEAAGDPEAKAQAMTFGPAQVLPLYAYRMYLDAVGSDPEEAMSGTIQVLESQPDAGIRQLLATAYISQYPDMKPRLYERLAQTQVSLPDIQPQTPATEPRTSVVPKVLATQ